MDRDSGCPHLHREAEIVKPSNETLGELGFVATIEMISAEVTIVSPVLEHVIGRGQHRGGDREDGFLGPTATLDAQELGAEIRVAGPGRGPRRLDEGSFEPGIARARPSGEPLARAFVQTRTEASPRGDQVVDGGAKGREGGPQTRL